MLLYTYSPTQYMLVFQKPQDNILPNYSEDNLDCNKYLYNFSTEDIRREKIVYTKSKYV